MWKLQLIILKSAKIIIYQQILDNQFKSKKLIKYGVQETWVKANKNVFI